MKNRVQMKQIATLLRIPRAHHAYIVKYGAYDFIEKCEELIHNNDKERLRKRDMDERAEKRTKVNIERLNQQKRGRSMQVEIPMPKFYRDKEIEQERLKELIQEKKKD